MLSALTPEKTPVIFDAGMPFMGPCYLQELETQPGEAGYLRHVLLTHSHLDHSGAAPFLKKKIPGLKITASYRAAEVFKRPNAIQQGERPFLINLAAKVKTIAEGK